MPGGRVSYASPRTLPTVPPPAAVGRYDGRHAVDPLGGGAAPHLFGRRARPAPPRGRPAPEPPRGRRAHLRRDARGGPRRRELRGGRGRRSRRGAAGRGDGRGRDTARRGPPRGAARRRVAARRPPRPAGQRRPTAEIQPGEVRLAPQAAADPLQDRERRTHQRPQRLDARGARLVPLPVRAGQPAPRVRPERRRPASASTCPPARAKRWAPGETQEVTLVRYAGRLGRRTARGKSPGTGR